LPPDQRRPRCRLRRTYGLQPDGSVRTDRKRSVACVLRGLRVVSLTGSCQCCSSRKDRDADGLRRRQKCPHRPHRLVLRMARLAPSGLAGPAMSELPGPTDGRSRACFDPPVGVCSPSPVNQPGNTLILAGCRVRRARAATLLGGRSYQIEATAVARPRLVPGQRLPRLPVEPGRRCWDRQQRRCARPGQRAAPEYERSGRRRPGPRQGWRHTRRARAR